MAGKRIAVLTLLSLVALALTVFSSSGTEAQSYKVTHGYSLANPAADAASDSLNDVVIGIPHYNYEDSSMFTLSPLEMNTKTGDQFPIGAQMGRLDSLATVGLLNNVCATALNVNFLMNNASTDTGDVLSPSEMAWLLKDNSLVPVPDGDADGLPDYLERYPHFLNDAFDPDGTGPLPPLEPRARYAGDSQQVANNNVLVQIVVFNPGQLTQLGGIYAEFDSAVGAPSLVVLNNPVNMLESPGTITDFCTPLRTTTTLYATTVDNPDTAADEGGLAAQTNPSAGAGILDSGTLISRNYSRSERDADGDGIENDLDPCFYTANSAWDPRVPGGAGTGDEDNDGLPDACDPFPNTWDDDEDNDGYQNRQDICPLVPNGCTQVSGCGPIANVLWDNQADTEAALPHDANANLGPNPDSIGDACDDSDDDGLEAGGGTTPGLGDCNDGQDNDADTLIDGNDPDCVDYMDKGEILLGNTPSQIWGTNPGTGIFYHATAWDAVCVGALDTDGDGYCDALEDTMNGTLPAGTLKNNGFESGADCDNAVDDDADTFINDGCPMVGFYAESDTECGTDSVSNDTPTPDTGEETLASETGVAPGGECFPGDLLDDDSDGYFNDGCPAVNAPETACDEVSCPNLAACDDDSDGSANDGCPAIGTWVNDGCPVIGVPETLIIQAGITAGTGALPAVVVPEVCSDGIDNDNDGLLDAADNDDLGCDPADDSYATDSDYDGHNPDNCPGLWNPEQIDTDSDTIGDACDPDDDNDGWNDTTEWWMGTDPFDDCPDVAGHDAWPLDNNADGFATVVPDILAYRGNVNAAIADDWTLGLRRLDLNADGYTTVVPDILSYRGLVNSGC